MARRPSRPADAVDAADLPVDIPEELARVVERRLREHDAKRTKPVDGARLLAKLRDPRS